MKKLTILLWPYVVVFIGCMLLAYTFCHAADTMRMQATSIRVDTDRPIIALWASIPSGPTVQRGADIPLSWSFQVHENTIPGITYISVISDCVSAPETDCSTNFISGPGLEIAQLSSCTSTLFPEPALSGLLDNLFHEILTDCTGRCCCETTLQVLPGDGCLLPVEPRTWSGVKQLFQ